MMFRTYLSLLWTLPLAAADICFDVRSAGIEVDRPLTLDYENVLQDYWSTACSSQRPTCILAPSDAQEVSTIITMLRFTNDTFAVKGGGHMPNVGFSSIDDGVLIAMRKFRTIEYDEGTQTVVLGSGLEWQEAQEGIEQTGRTVVGGRMGAVGLGGYLIGGGLSFLSSRWGWGVNSLVDVEMVLANGTIVHANDNLNSDLFNAVKGGGNNFGIITAYTLNTHPISPQIWGGNYIFPGSKSSEVISAVHDFSTNYPDDKAGIIATNVRGLLTDIWTIYLFYDGPSPPSHVFERFRSIGPISDTTETRTYLDLVTANNDVIIPGTIDDIASETTPLNPNTPSNSTSTILHATHERWTREVNAMTALPDVFATMTYQPLSRTISQKAGRGVDADGNADTETPGGSSVGLINFSDAHDYVVFQFHFSYVLSAVNSGQVADALGRIHEGTKELVDERIAGGELPDVRRPMYMNDLNGSQDYWGRLGADKVAFARGVREMVDPERFWQTRTSGGFRLG